MFWATVGGWGVSVDEGKERASKFEGRRGRGSGRGARNMEDRGGGEELERTGEEEGVWRVWLKGKAYRGRAERKARQGSRSRGRPSLWDWNQ